MEVHFLQFIDEALLSSKTPSLCAVGQQQLDIIDCFGHILVTKAGSAGTDRDTGSVEPGSR